MITYSHSFRIPFIGITITFSHTERIRRSYGQDMANYYGQD